jgi:hypothetical protein
MCMMVNLKCPSLYDRVDGLREHDTIVDEVVVRGGGCKCFRNVLNRITSPCGNLEVVLPPEASAIVFLSYCT